MVQGRNNFDKSYPIFKFISELCVYHHRERFFLKISNKSLRILKAYTYLKHNRILIIFNAFFRTTSSLRTNDVVKWKNIYSRRTRFPTNFILPLILYSMILFLFLRRKVRNYSLHKLFGSTPCTPYLHPHIPLMRWMPGSMGNIHAVQLYRRPIPCIQCMVCTQAIHKDTMQVEAQCI